jgi:hypothetical protein
MPAVELTLCSGHHDAASAVSQPIELNEGLGMQLTDKQYEILLHMYHNWVEMFRSLPDATKDAFYRRLFGE